MGIGTAELGEEAEDEEAGGSAILDLLRSSLSEGVISTPPLR